MANWHGYMAVENLNLNATKAATLWQVIKGKGSANESNNPAYRNHSRLSLDQSKGIFEALFNQDNMTVDWFQEQLEIIFGVIPGAADSTVQNVTFVTRNTPVATFSINATDYLRFAAFGGVGATWEQSRVEVLGYLSANSAEWEAAE